MKSFLIYLFLFFFLSSCGGNGAPSQEEPSPGPSVSVNQEDDKEPPECFTSVMGNSELTFNDKRDFFEQVRRIPKNCQSEDEFKRLNAFLRQKLNKDKNYFKEIEEIFNLKGE